MAALREHTTAEKNAAAAGDPSSFLVASAQNKPLIHPTRGANYCDLSSFWEREGVEGWVSVVTLSVVQALRTTDTEQNACSQRPSNKMSLHSVCICLCARALRATAQRKVGHG